MTQEQMSQKIAEMGCKHVYKPVWEQESETITIKTRKPAVIVDGLLEGTEINIYDSQTFQVWTPQKQKAVRIAKENGFKARPLDGEAELFIPAEKADQFLKMFGAKIKGNWKVSPQATEALRQYMANKRLAS